MMPWLNVARVLAFSSATVLGAGLARADVVTAWNEQVVANGGPQVQRTLAMVHIAMFDAVNAIDKGYTSYSRVPQPPADASPIAAAAGAAYGVLVRLFPTEQPVFWKTFTGSLAEVPDGPAKDAGVAFGDEVARAIYEARLEDNILAPGPPIVDGTEPGQYRRTTPGPPEPVNTGAPSWIPFAMRSASQFRPPGPPSLTSKWYARDVDETQRLGGTVSAQRTADQEEYARWHTEQAPFQFNRIARTEVEKDGRSLVEHARLFALLNMAMADATTAVFDAKYTYLFWRPSTAIQNADADGNPETDADPNWMPFLATPPHPEYPAAHAVIQGAAALVLTHYFGRRYAFETTSPTVPDVTRTYESFDHFAREGAAARIVGGMHFRTSLVIGAFQGRTVGYWVLTHLLRPTDSHGPHVTSLEATSPRP